MCLFRSGFAFNNTVNSEKLYLKEVTEEEKLRFEHEDNLLKYTRKFLSDNQINIYNQKVYETDKLL